MHLLALAAAAPAPARSDGRSVFVAKGQACHRPGAAAPFALAAPEDAIR
jgi:mono/diheme cytochrome c family protein